MADLRQQEQQKKQQKKSGKKEGLGFAILIAAIAIIQGIDEIDAEMIPVLVLTVLGIVAVSLVIRAISLAAKKAQKAEKPDRAIHRPDPRNRSFTPPEPSCIVCEHTGEDHFARDKAQRIARLDEWLKNGIVDKDEYRVLKERYERDL